MRVAPEIILSDQEKKTLEKLARSNTTSVRLARRAKIILLAARGMENQEIAAQLNTGRIQVGRWRQRYAEGGMEAIEKDLPRGGRKPSDVHQRIIELTTQTTPENATHWSTRSMAEEVGVSAATVSRVWRAHGLKPHRIETFKVSRDPKFVEKLEDIVGLYLNPPEHALVLSCDEKSQVQALDRTQPGLPLKKGRAATMTHDYKRHGTTTLFAALNTLDGSVISRCESRHRHTEWLRFLKQINRETPKDKELHLICDNYSTHKHAKVKAWLEKHPRFHVHFTPTSASWLNMVERFFRDLTTDRLRRGVFHSVPDLIRAIKGYVETHNENPKPFIWTAQAKDILQKVIRANKRLSSKQNAALHQVLPGAVTGSRGDALVYGLAQAGLILYIQNRVVLAGKRGFRSILTLGGGTHCHFGTAQPVESLVQPGGIAGCFCIANHERGGHREPHGE
jgi:transposase